MSFSGSSLGLVGVETGFDETEVQNLHLAPFVLSDLVDRDPGRWVIIKHSFDEILKLSADSPILAFRELRPKKLSVFALPERFIKLDRLERILSHDHHEQGNP